MQVKTRWTHRAATIGAAALLSTGLVACGSGGDTNSGNESTGAGTTRTFQAANGAIEIPADPKSIVACGYAVLPLIQSGADLSGICEWTREDDNMDDATRKAYDAIPKVGPDGAISELNYEAVTAANPDLIILGVPARAQSEVDMAKLQAIAPVVFLGPTTPAEWRTLGEQFAAAANVSDSYGQSIEQYDARAQEISDKYRDKLGSLKFAGVCNICGTEPGEFVREYESSYVTNLFDDLGLQFPGTPDDPADKHAEYVSNEKIMAKLGDADVIVYGVELDGSLSPELQDLMASPLWQALPAVKAGNLVPVKHSHAATHQTALLALDSIDEGLGALPAAKQ
ncbi:ABC transporter substrate-binding protein [Prescottella defluvii]|uniref:ABC transporter substrate-binding protein n=1 Tax=Prescottella defluvii TaxID=1323361 RepID=UPI0004F275BC|nr:ABC transporter substrate-binding protein [Prescottella defluvii]